MNRREIGKEKETQAVLYLEKQGYTILDRNYWTRFGEIDIVAEDDGYLCFVEVKYRENAGHGAPEGVVTRKKQQNIIRTMYYYLQAKQISPDVPVRFDVIMIVGDTTTLVKHAFEISN